ncbi:MULTISPECIES: hypothetical protein [Mycobacteroides]|jgi:hypothetical protein|nr:MULTISPECIES: hypothetical protein [Mycobacteroides]SKN59042.1 Uncharacterised protein [Mycobacteroides abscessus subsp. massiliense]SKR64939.1 Uncharacterised protein [Mycobacteroides abscessus subsp. abscessus]SLH53419.1 Uncharacterised protein [Mycobacteroides abscessus subsp. massiliense]
MRQGWASLAASFVFAGVGAVTAQGGWLVPAIVAAMLSHYFFSGRKGNP